MYIFTSGGRGVRASCWGDTKGNGSPMKSRASLAMDLSITGLQTVLGLEPTKIISFMLPLTGPNWEDLELCIQESISDPDRVHCFGTGGSAHPSSVQLSTFPSSGPCSMPQPLSHQRQGPSFKTWPSLLTPIVWGSPLLWDPAAKRGGQGWPLSSQRAMGQDT